MRLLMLIDKETTKKQLPQFIKKIRDAKLEEVFRVTREYFHIL